MYIYILYIYIWIQTLDLIMAWRLLQPRPAGLGDWTINWGFKRQTLELLGSEKSNMETQPKCWLFEASDIRNWHQYILKMQEMGLSKDGGVAPSHAHQIWCYPYSHKLQALVVTYTCAFCPKIGCPQIWWSIILLPTKIRRSGYIPILWQTQVSYCWVSIPLNIRLVVRYKPCFLWVNWLMKGYN